MGSRSGGRQLWVHGTQEGPMGGGGRNGGCGAGSGIRGPHADPFLERGNLLRLEGLLLGRHLIEVFGRPLDRLNQKTALRLAGFNGASGGATLEQSVPGIDPEATLDFLGGGRMAAIAAVDQYRTNLVFEEFHLFGRQSPGHGMTQGGDRSGKCDQHHAVEDWKGGHRFQGFGQCAVFPHEVKTRGV